MKTSIRLALESDAEMLTELARRTFHDAFAPMNSPENMESYIRQNFTLDKFIEQLADPHAIFLIAEIEAAPIGFAKLYEGDAPDCVEGIAPIEIERFYIDRQFHGKGVARTLMEACFDCARRSGHKTVFLGVWERNHRAIAFYRKYGFEVVGSQCFPDGRRGAKRFFDGKKLAGAGEMKAPLIVWLVLCIIWGSTWLFIKLGLRDLPPFTFAGLRFLLASVILWAIVIVWRRPLPKNGSDWLKLAWDRADFNHVEFRPYFLGRTAHQFRTGCGIAGDHPRVRPDLRSFSFAE